MNKSLKTIAVDLTPVLPGGENGGAKIFVLELLRCLSEIAPQAEFILLTQAASHDELAILDRRNMRRMMVIGPVVAQSIKPRLENFAVRVLRHLPNRLRRIASRFAYGLNTALKRHSSHGLLRGLKADLLYCPFTAPTYFESGIPTVCTVHDLQYKTYPEFFAAEDVAHRDRTFTEAARRASVIAAVSDYSRNSAILHGSLDPVAIRTIHSRLAKRILPAAEHDKSVLSRLGLKIQRYIVYPANFWKHKNHEMLLAAFGMACSTALSPDIKLVCTGAPGERQSWLINAARAMKLSERIVFPGFLPDAELAALIANCSGVIFPSLYEGFGLPVIEAMAAGVPVACSNTTSLPEVAADAAILFDPRVPTQIAEAMSTLIYDEPVRTRLIQAGLERAMEFSDSMRMAREYWAVFEYASTNAKHDNLLVGAYPDGWAGPVLTVHVAPAADKQTLELEFLAPEWLPTSKLTIYASGSGKFPAKSIKIASGTVAQCTLPVDATGGTYEIRISPTFVPAQAGHGDDQRELSAMLQRCVVKNADGQQVQLFPEVAST